MGVVFQARQVSLNRPVALKMILAGQLADDTDVKRFYTEAEAAANLDHPGIVPIYEVGQHEGQHYFTMGFVEGQSLAQRLADGPLPPREAAALMVKVAEAIEYAHQHGVIHRDLKPANILLDRNGNPRVTDFGLAKKLAGRQRADRLGPDHGDAQLHAAGAGRRAAGRRSGRRPTSMRWGRRSMPCSPAGRRSRRPRRWTRVLQVIGEEPVPPRRLNPAVAARPGDDLPEVPGEGAGPAVRLGARRWPTTCGRFLAGEPILARPVGPAERLWRWCRRNPVVAGLAGGIAMALALGTVVATSFAVLADRAAVRRHHAAQLAREEKQVSDRRLYIAEMNLARREWRRKPGPVPNAPEGLSTEAVRQHRSARLQWYYLDRLHQRA